MFPEPIFCVESICGGFGNLAPLLFELFTIYKIFSKKSENFDDKIHPEEKVSVGFWDISCVRVELKYCGIAWEIMVMVMVASTEQYVVEKCLKSRKWPISRILGLLWWTAPVVKCQNGWKSVSRSTRALLSCVLKDFILFRKIREMWPFKNSVRKIYFECQRNGHFLENSKILW